MGHDGGSPRRRSPSRRERSPGRQKISDRSSSLTREKKKHSGRAKSRSLSPRSKRLMTDRDEREALKVRDRDNQRNRGRGSDKGTPRDRSCSPSPRTERLRRGERDSAKMSEKHHERNNGKTVEKGRHSPISQSPSPRTKRLRRAEAEKEADYAMDRKHEKNHVRGSDKDSPKERNSDRETGRGRKERRHSDREVEDEKKERRSERDEISHKSSRRRHESSVSPLNHSRRSRHRSCSPQSIDDARARDEVSNTRGSEHGRDDDDDDDSVAKMKAAEEALETKEKHKPSFELSGKLAAETNRFRGVTLLFNEPPDARKADIRWRLYVFKAGEVLKEPLYIHRQTCYLFGRERRVADIPTDHPSCSKQHAVIQFRQVEKEQPDGMLTKQVRPYLMDLGSTIRPSLMTILLNHNAIMNFLRKTPLNLVTVAENMCCCMRTRSIDAGIGRIMQVFWDPHMEISFGFSQNNLNYVCDKDVVMLLFQFLSFGIRISFLR